MLQKLGDAVNIKVMLSKVLGVPPATLHLHRIDGGNNITLVFSVPDSIAKELFPLPKEKIDLLKVKGMVLFVPQDLKYGVCLSWPFLNLKNNIVCTYRLKM